MERFVEDFDVVCISDKLGVNTEFVTENIRINTDIFLNHIIQDAKKFMKHSRRNNLTDDDIDRALILHGRKNYLSPRYNSNQVLESSRQLKSNKNKIEFLEDKTVDLTSFVKFGLTKLPPVPTYPTMNIHWLAVNGVQTETPENPKISKISTEKEIISLTKSVSKNVSEELQEYFSKVVEHIVDNNIEYCSHIFKAIQYDDSITAILPYLVQLSVANVKFGLKIKKRTNAIAISLQLLRSISRNKTFPAPTLLLHMLPSLLSCVVNRKVSYEDKLFAARILTEFVNRFKLQVMDLQPRIIKTLTGVLSSSKPQHLLSYTGAVLGLSSLGVIVTTKYILPKAEFLLEEAKNRKKAKQNDKDIIIQEVIRAVSTVINKNKCDFDEETNKTICKIQNLVGEILIYYSPMTYDSSSVFI